jgi:hypothetical protein
MSSGPSDAAAEGRLIDAVFGAAFDLAKAIKAAHGGHRGMYFSNHQILKEVNDCLSETEFRLIIRESSR